MSKTEKAISSRKQTDAKKSRHEQIICMAGYILVPLFFVTLYLIMFMSYEDIYQSYAWHDKNVPEIIKSIYLFIPRTGEIFQRIAAHFMTISTSFSPDLFFRIITALMGFLTVYLSTFFILKKRPQLQYRDVSIYLGLFLLLLVFETSEVLTFRFSYANNYLTAAALTVGFLLPFRIHAKAKHPWQYFGMLVLGILFGMSTEIGTLAILAIFCFWFLIKLFKKQINRSFFSNNKLQLIGIIGMIIGITLAFANGSLLNRASSNYGEYYDYVSIFDVLKGNALVTLYKLWQHAWFNMRYLMFAPFMIGIFILTESLIGKHVKKPKNNIRFYLCTLVFCALYMGASCQLKVLDDLYPRYFFLIYVSIFISIFAFINFLFDAFSPSPKLLRIFARILLIITIISLLDMVAAFTIYHIQISDQLYKIQPDYENQTVLITEEYSKTTMIPSPIFKLSQLSPFDWGNLGDGYMKYGYGPKAD